MSIPESVAITKSNIFTQVFANIFNLINTRSNVPDPNDSTGRRKFVYSHREPNFMARNFSGYPCVIVEGVNMTQNIKTVSSTKAFQFDEINIIVMSQDKSSDASGDPSGADTLNSISDDIVEVLNANNGTLRNNGLSRREIDSTDFDWGEIDGQPTFRREITLTFNQLRTVA